MNELKTRRTIRPRQPIFMDRLDESVVEKVMRHPEGISPTDLQREYPDEFGDVSYNSLYYHINTLAEDGYLRVERHRKALLCFPAEE